MGLRFANAAALYALASLVGLVLLHLYRQRRRERVVPSLLIWRKLAAQTEHLRRRRIVADSSLLLQLVAAGALVGALARPELSLPSRGSMKIALIIDVSAGMKAKTPEGPSRFETARRKARELLSNLSDIDRVAVFTFPSVGRRLSPAPPSRALEFLKEIDPTDAPDRRPEAALAEALAALGGEDARFWIFTDTAPDFGAKLDRVRWVDVARRIPNAGIVAFEVREREAGLYEVYCAVGNYGGAASSRELRFFVDGREVPGAARTLALSPGQRLDVSLELRLGARMAGGEPGVLEARLSMAGAGGAEAQDALEADDVARWVLGTRKLRVSIADAVGGDLCRAVEASGVAQATDREPDLVVAQGRLPNPPPERFVLIDPAGEAGSVKPGESFKPKEFKTTASALVADVDLAGVSASRATGLVAGADCEVLATADGVPVIVRRAVGRERGYWIGLALGETNWPQRAAFPIFMARVLGDVAPACGINPVEGAFPTGRVGAGCPGRLVDARGAQVSAAEAAMRVGVYKSAEPSRRVAFNLVSPQESDIGAEGGADSALRSASQSTSREPSIPPAGEETGSRRSIPLGGVLLGLALAAAGCEWWLSAARARR